MFKTRQRSAAFAKITEEIWPCIVRGTDSEGRLWEFSSTCKKTRRLHESYMRSFRALLRSLEAAAGKGQYPRRRHDTARHARSQRGLKNWPKGVERVGEASPARWRLPNQ
jgi:hypothetical protein